MNTPKPNIFFVLLLLLLPFVTGGMCTGNWHFIKLLYIGTAVILVAVPYLLLPNIGFKKVYFIVIGLLLMTWSLNETFLYFQEGIDFNELQLKIFLESNPRELLEFMQAIIPMWTLIGGSILIVLLIWFLFSFKHVANAWNLKRSLMLLMFFGGAAFVQFFAQIDTKSKFGIFALEYEAGTNLKAYYKSILKSPAVLQATIAALDLQHSKPAAPKTYVLIVGESSSKHHFGLYNYWRNTTPRLRNRKDIGVYTDVISSNTSTIECLSKCLTFGSTAQVQHNFGNINIIDVANACGIKTFWLSNQNKEAILYNSIVLGTAQAKQISYLKDSVQASTFDAELIPYLQKALLDTAIEKLIVLHLMGTHFKFNQRFPPAFNAFANIDSVKKNIRFADTKTKQMQVNDYDNAVLYQDYLLDSIFTILQNQKNNTSCIYFSDHGEEVFDYRNFVGHTPQANSAWLHEIPLVTWHMPQMQNVSKPYQMTHFFHSLAQWMQIDFNGFDATKSLWSDSLQMPERKMGNGDIYKKTYP